VIPDWSFVIVSSFGFRHFPLFDVDLAHAFLLTDDFDLIANLVGKPDGVRDRFDENEWRRRVGGIHLDVLHAEQSIQKRLSRLDVFHTVQFQRVGHLAKNTFRDFQSLARQLIDFIFRLEITSERNKDRHNEPAEERAQNIHAKVFPLRRTAPPNGLFRHVELLARCLQSHKHLSSVRVSLRDCVRFVVIPSEVEVSLTELTVRFTAPPPWL
jgi:hypothetical protein